MILTLPSGAYKGNSFSFFPFHFFTATLLLSSTTLDVDSVFMGEQPVPSIVAIDYHAGLDCISKLCQALGDGAGIDI